MNRVSETIAAVSGNFHADSRHEEFFNDNTKELEGFQGMWNYLAKAGVIFAAAEAETEAAGAGIYHGQWLCALQNFSEALYRGGENGVILSDAELRILAATSIRNNGEIG